MTTSISTRGQSSRNACDIKKLFPPVRTIVGLIVLALVCFIAPYLRVIQQGDPMLDARAINLMLLQYSMNHQDEYPTGRTSTEAFQKLIDGGYVSDPGGDEPGRGAAIFCGLYPGKTPATSNKLRSENVAWDLIVPVKRMPDEMPILILTGYRLELKPNGGAIPQPWPPRSWGDWMENIDYPRGHIAFARQAGAFIREAAPDGSIPNLVPANFDPAAESYRQLTPDGTLP